MGKRAPRTPSTVGWFFPLPWLESAVGSVAPLACPLALVAARVPPVTIYGAARNDSKLVTILVAPAVVGLAGL